VPRNFAWFPLLLTTLVLGLTGLGYVPVPGTAGSLTILHIPVILAGVLCGPLPGLGVGLTFGLTNFWLMPPHDPLVQIVPRVLCGGVAALVFWLARRHGNPDAQLTLGSMAAALSASFTNTIGVVLLATLKGHMPAQEVLGVIVFHGFPEALLAVVVTLPFAVSRYRK